MAAGADAAIIPLLERHVDSQSCAIPSMHVCIAQPAEVMAKSVNAVRQTTYAMAMRM